MALAQKHDFVAVVPGMNMKFGLWRQVLEKNSALDFRLHNPAIDLITEVGMGREHG